MRLQFLPLDCFIEPRLQTLCDDILLNLHRDVQASVVEQLLLSHVDVKPTMLVNGTVVGVEPYGAFVQLAEGLKALCPLQHMSEFERSTPSSKFQVCGFNQRFCFL